MAEYIFLKIKNLEILAHKPDALFWYKISKCPLFVDISEYVNEYIHSINSMNFLLLGCDSSNNCSHQGPNTCRPRRWHVRRVSNGEKFHKNLEKRFSICNSQEFIRWNYCGGNYDDCQSGIFDEFLSGLLYFTIAVKSVRN